MKTFETVLNFNREKSIYENGEMLIGYLGALDVFKSILGYSRVKLKLSKKPFKGSRAFRYLDTSMPAIKESTPHSLYRYEDTLYYLGTLDLEERQTFYIKMEGVS